MAKRRRSTRFVPELVFGTICASTVIPACSSGTTTSKKDGGAGTGAIQGVAAGGFGGASVFAGGFGGAVAAGGFGGTGVGGTGGLQGVAAGGFGGTAGLPGVAAGGFAGQFSVAAGGFSPDGSAMLDNVNDPDRWAVTGAFGELDRSVAMTPRRRAQNSKGRRARKRRG